MDCIKVGNLILALRKEKGMTQKQLADKMNISDKTVSKWERGLGCPDVSLLPELSDILGVNIEKILSGNMESNESDKGNMKNTKFYVCPDCGNIITSTSSAAVSCCGRKLEELVPIKAEASERLSVESVEDDWFVSSGHEMTKEHYIAFVAYLTGDTVLIKKQYPEWDMHTRLPKCGHGMLVWYCTKHGLFSQFI